MTAARNHKSLLQLRRLCRATIACFSVGVSLIVPRAGWAIDLTNLGGALSNDLPGRHALQVAAPNVTEGERVAAQAAGFPLFHRTVTRSEGLGPRFVHNSCAGCHVNNGRGPTVFGDTKSGGSAMVVKLKRRGLLGDGSPPEVRGFGGQLLDHSVTGDRSKSVSLLWEYVKSTYPDGTSYRLRKPILSFSRGVRLPPGTITSLRMSPPIIGAGLLEAIPATGILSGSDPTDKDGDGISGRVNWVRDRDLGGYSIGRFGFKASHPTVAQQSGAALYHDMGIENPLFFDRADEYEISREELDSLALYLRLAGVPRARSQEKGSVISGQEIFRDIGCDSCHRMTWKTGTHVDPELSNQTIHPFTDLLLHDMGDGLADGWNEFSANGREWRTTPLWGLGFSAILARGKAAYLHDGRARSIEEAILWHGGEAKRSQEAFRSLSVEKRRELLDFLRSL